MGRIGEDFENKFTLSPKALSHIIDELLVAEKIVKDNYIPYCRQGGTKQIRPPEFAHSMDVIHAALYKYHPENLFNRLASNRGGIAWAVRDRKEIIRRLWVSKELNRMFVPIRVNNPLNGMADYIFSNNLNTDNIAIYHKYNDNYKMYTDKYASYVDLCVARTLEDGGITPRPLKLYTQSNLCFPTLRTKMCRGYEQPDALEY